MKEYLLMSKRRIAFYKGDAAVSAVNGRVYRLPYGRPARLPEHAVEVLRQAGHRVLTVDEAEKWAEQQERKLEAMEERQKEKSNG